MRIYLAGATGVIGRRLLGLLVAAGHHVTGTTRSAERAESIAAAGGTPAVVDVYDVDRLVASMIAARPDVVIHQLTDLPHAPDSGALAAAFENNARLRVEGTGNLMRGVAVSSARRVIAQSISFIYADGPKPHREDDPLDRSRTGPSERSLQAVMSLEQQVTSVSAIEGLVLRYGRLYGPGAWVAAPHGKGFVHADAAAYAALLAVNHGAPGIYNIADDDGEISIEKARRELGFDPAARLPAAG